MQQTRVCYSLATRCLHGTSPSSFYIVGRASLQQFGNFPKDQSSNNCKVDDSGRYLLNAGAYDDWEEWALLVQQNFLGFLANEVKLHQDRYKAILVGFDAWDHKLTSGCTSTSALAKLMFLSFSYRRCSNERREDNIFIWFGTWETSISSRVISSAPSTLSNTMVGQRWAISAWVLCVGRRRCQLLVLTLQSPRIK